MKKLILLFTICLSSNLFAQDYIKLAQTEFKTAEECKEAEPKVLECANYILNTSATANELNRLSAFQYMFKWMEGTADYTFSIDAEVVDLTKGDTNYMSVYFAGMVQTVLQNQGDPLDDKQMHEAGLNKLVDYCADSSKGLKPNRPIKKLIKKRKKS